jgi:hypothetical protein
VSQDHRCDRFEQEGVALSGDGARDAESEAHLAGCETCQAHRRSHQRLTEWLGEPPAGPGPTAGWEARVLERVRPRPRLLRRPLVWGALGGTLAAAAALFIVLRPADPAPWLRIPEVGIIESRSAQLRGGSLAAAPGDTLSIRAPRGRFPTLELRVFRGGELVFRCPGRDGCDRAGNQLAARVPLTFPGQYQALLVWAGAGPLPAPAASVEDDAARLIAAGAHVQALDPIAVR